MVAAAPHRGTETQVISHGGVALGVSSGDGLGTEHVASDRYLAAAFSGCFDNADELARSLGLTGASGAGAADILLAGFRAHGALVARRMRGVFSAVVTDGRRLWGFRDHVGFKPLVYRHEARGLFVATEARQILAGAERVREPDLEIVEAIFYNRSNPDLYCAVKGVRRVPGGAVLSGDLDGARTDRYWHPERVLETARLGAGELQERFDELMHTAVRRALRGADAVSLSGGVDSPAVAAYAAPAHLERTGERLAALSAFYPKYPRVDESEIITQVAQELGMPLRSYEPSVTPTDGLAKWIGLFDSPVSVVSLSETAETLEHARRFGIRNILTGELAEFVFDMRRGVMGHLLATGRFKAALRYARTRRRRGTRRLSVLRDAGLALAPPWLVRAYRARRPRRRWRPAPWITAPGPTESPWDDPRGEWRQVQMAGVAGRGIDLEADDHIQSACGVGTRRPWADVDLWEFFLSLPAELKFPDPGSKSLVRRLLRGRVPDVVLDRTHKTVFDDSIADRIDYEALKGWLANPAHRVAGVDYALLADRLERGDLNLVEFMWAKDLAGVHAFLAGF